MQVVSSTEAPMTASEAWDAAVEACAMEAARWKMERCGCSYSAATECHAAAAFAIRELKGRCPDALSGESK